MTGPSDRRGFLRGLTTLPLIGGGVTLIGAPTAAAVPVTAELLDSYDAWLLFERRILRQERGEPYASREFVRMDNHGGAWHWDREKLQPSQRAAVVLSAAGVSIA